MNRKFTQKNLWVSKRIIVRYVKQKIYGFESPYRENPPQKIENTLRTMEEQKLEIFYGVKLLPEKFSDFQENHGTLCKTENL